MRRCTIGNTRSRWRWMTGPSVSTVLKSMPNASCPVTSTVMRIRSWHRSVVSPASAARSHFRCRRPTATASLGKNGRTRAALSPAATRPRCRRQSLPSAANTPSMPISRATASIARQRRNRPGRSRCTCRTAAASDTAATRIGPQPRPVERPVAVGPALEGEVQPVQADLVQVADDRQGGRTVEVPVGLHAPSSMPRGCDLAAWSAGRRPTATARSVPS